MSSSQSEQIELLVQQMEEKYQFVRDILNLTNRVVEDWPVALKAFQDLERWYQSASWMEIYELDENKKLSRDLSRECLSQDGMWNLIEDFSEIRTEIHRLLAETDEAVENRD